LKYVLERGSRCKGFVYRVCLDGGGCEMSFRGADGVSSKEMGVF
jgi:hypothetical protein